MWNKKDIHALLEGEVFLLAKIKKYTRNRASTAIILE